MKSREDNRKINPLTRTGELALNGTGTTYDHLDFNTQYGSTAGSFTKQTELSTMRN